MSSTARRFPGRVNRIGDHTGYAGGFALPLGVDGVDRGTPGTLERGGRVVELVWADEPDPAVVAVDVDDPLSLPPGWPRYVAGIVARLRPGKGGTGAVAITCLSAQVCRRAPLWKWRALALRFEGTPLELALACQRSEQRVWGASRPE